MTKKYISSALLHIFVFKNCQLWITMKTVEKAHCIVNQEKIGGCNSQKEERRYDEEMTCPMTINQQWRHVKHSHPHLSLLVCSTDV